MNTVSIVLADIGAKGGWQAAAKQYALGWLMHRTMNLSRMPLRRESVCGNQNHCGQNRRGCSNSTVNGVAEELASRGFVVLSLSAYGSGSSETQDVGDPRMDPSLGIYDGLQYLRTLQYIDKTRIGMVGHSQGSKNVAAG